jgi:hypothetical protein
MNPDIVSARSAIEALRSGVPSRHAVAQLGTTQQKVRERFEAALEAVEEGRSAAPLVVSANFGAGKSHLLEYLQTLAERERFVTSYVVVSPEMPLGNAHVVLKTLAETARAPGRTGEALRALTTDFNASSKQFADLRLWARDADIDDRFRALLHLYEEYRVDNEFRTQILGDFEGKPLLKTIIKGRLRQIGEAAGYDLRGPRQPLLAHDRIRLLARFYRACTGRGLVVLFDEVELIARFSLKQRIAAYQELGWWRDIAEQEGSAILPVFAYTSGFVEESITGGTRDEQRFLSTTLGYAQEERDQLAMRGIEMLKSPFRLESPTPEQDAEVRYRIKAIYEQAYGISLPPLADERRDVRTTIRSEIRRWITGWDMRRYYPEYAPEVEENAVEFDTAEIPDEAIETDEEEREE